MRWLLLLLLITSCGHQTETNNVIQVINAVDIIIFDKVARTGRLVGLATPQEDQPAGSIESYEKEATTFTKNWLATHDESWSLINELDNPDGRDPQGRLLVWLHDEVEVLNVELVRAGLARVKTDGYKNLAFINQLREAQQEAMSAKRGIWSVVPKMATCPKCFSGGTICVGMECGAETITCPVCRGSGIVSTEVALHKCDQKYNCGQPGCLNPQN